MTSLTDKRVTGMNWTAPDRYHLESACKRYRIAIYHSSKSRDLIAWKGSVKLGHRNVITTVEQYEQAKAELKQVCEEDVGK